MIMRAIQKKRMSHPDSSKLVGKSLKKSEFSIFGQPRIAIGQRPELNHVLKTVSAWNEDCIDDLTQGNPGLFPSGSCDPGTFAVLQRELLALILQQPSVP